MPYDYEEQSVLPTQPTAADVARNKATMARIIALLWQVAVFQQSFLRLFPERFEGWHRDAFGPTWGSASGTFRADGQNGHYLVAVQPGKAGTARKMRHGAKGGRQIIKRLEDSCRHFHRHAGPRPFVTDLDLKARIALAANVYIDILKIQPFPYGNDAIALLALQTAYKRLSLRGVFPKFEDEFYAAVAIALLAPRRTGQDELVRVLAAGNGTQAVDIVDPIPGDDGKGLRHPGND